MEIEFWYSQWGRYPEQCHGEEKPAFFSGAVLWGPGCFADPGFGQEVFLENIFLTVSPSSTHHINQRMERR